LFFVTLCVGVRRAVHITAVAQPTDNIYI